MSCPEEPTPNRTQAPVQSDNRKPGSVIDPAARDSDCFVAEFAAARGTVSPELDLGADVDEPAATDRTGDAGRLRPGA